MPTTLRQIFPARSGVIFGVVSGPPPIKRLLVLAVLTVRLPLVVLLAALDRRYASTHSADLDVVIL